MANTYQAIASVTVGAGGASNIAFSSIPQTFTDLCVKLSLRTNSAAVVDTPVMRLNGTNADQTTLRLMGNGSTVSSSSVSPGIYLTRCPGAGATSNTFGNIDVYIPNYAGSTLKSISIDQVAESNSSTVDGVTALMAGLWSSTSAITAISILSDNGNNFVQYSTATLYGIKNS